MKKNLLFLAILCLLMPSAFSQGADPVTLVTFSSGIGMGSLSEGFTLNDAAVDLKYLAPGARINAELSWNNFYMEMALAILFAPITVTLGGDTVDLSDYELNMAADLTAFSIGYSFPITGALSGGGAIGFHVTSVTLTPPDSDYTRLGLEGYYGLIGINFTPRLRYAFGKSFVATLEIPIGLDFSPMSDDVVVGGVNTGMESPAIVSPAGLDPTFKGFTTGLYLSVGYRFPL